MIRVLRKRDGLTLVEMVAVLSCLTALAALLIPAAAHARHKARRVACASQLRQQGLALQGFVADFHVYPLYRNVDYAGHGYPAGAHSWASALEEWELSGRNRREFRQWVLDDPPRSVWHCPAAASAGGVQVISYGYNAYGFRDSTDEESHGLGGCLPETSSGYVVSAPVRESEAHSPGELMALGDAFMGGGVALIDTRDRLERIPTAADPSGSAGRVRARHRGMANVGFADGHVESLPLQALFEDLDEAVLRRWNRAPRPL